MPQTTCHNTFAEVQLRRRSHPLKAGADKLREARHRLSRMMKTIDAIRDFLRNPASVMSESALGPCCTTFDKAIWLKSVPDQLAEKLGYDILPAIAALTADGVPKTVLAAELKLAQATANQLLKDCEAQRVRLKGGIKPEYAAIKSGRSELCDLLIGGYHISQPSLGLIAEETW